MVQNRPSERRPNDAFYPWEGCQMRSLQLGAQTPYLSLLGLDTTYPSPSIALTVADIRHVTFKAILPLPDGNEASGSHGLPRSSYLRSRATGI